mgnify:CR=1 FL=1|jgi:hypothetical protein|tara:strand:+ start:3742 stop:3885 length:144 start_codon:yes stop_codon:yes gene_type:complete
MKYVLLGATIINGLIGSYNMIFADMSWGVFNFTVAALCAYSYLQLED